MVSEDTNRETKLKNIMLNQSIILMSTLMEGFGEAFAKAAGAMAVDVAGAVGSLQNPQEAKRVQKELKSKIYSIDIPKQLQNQMAKSKKDMKSQMAAHEAELSKLLSDPMVDEGIRITNRYEFKGLPRLTEDLNEEQIAAYVILLRNLDPQFTKMFKQLTAWQEKVQTRIKGGPIALPS